MAKPAKKKRKAEVPQDFESVAKCLECDEDKVRFEEKLGEIATAKSTKGAP